MGTYFCSNLQFGNWYSPFREITETVQEQGVEKYDED